MGHVLRGWKVYWCRGSGSSSVLHDSSFVELLSYGREKGME